MSHSNKRNREEDEEELAELQKEHKKPRPLPFRTSPTTQHTLLFSQSFRSSPKPPTLTPAESSADEDEYPFHRLPVLRKKSSTPPSFITTTEHPDPDSDSDLDMIDSPDSPPWTKAASSPAQSRLHLSNNTLANGTRIPTPIYGHFNRRQDSHPSLPLTIQTTSTTVPKSQELSNSHSLFLTRRRLPSPISEDEAMDSPLTRTGSMLHRLDMNAVLNPKNGTSLHHQGSTPMTPTDDYMMETVGNGSDGLGIQGRDGSIRDERRGAVVGWEGKEKVSLSMGYRADCEKCRSRVPGHWSHVVRG